MQHKVTDMHVLCMLVNTLGEKKREGEGDKERNEGRKRTKEGKEGRKKERKEEGKEKERVNILRKECAEMG